jgi:succinate dehydrogenase/fumarate reductase cytochrome b subunit
MKTKTLHRVNGTVLAVFVFMHMVTHLSGLFGIAAYSATQSAMRHIYRNPITEPVLLLAFTLQVGIGVLLLSKGFKRKLAERWARTQVLSGLILALFINQHLAALIFTRWADGLDTTFYWPASVMSDAPFYWYFAPYYFLGVCAMFVHLACAIRLNLLRRKHPHAARRLFWATSLAGIVVAVAINLMLHGLFYDIVLPEQWVAYLHKYVPDYGL